MVKNKSILGSRHPTPSRAAFRRLPLLTATTRRSRLKTQSRLLRSSRARSRSIRRLKIQTEFAKTAYETFVTESQKITALYGDLAKQSYKPFGSFIAKMTPTNR